MTVSTISPRFSQGSFDDRTRAVLAEEELDEFDVETFGDVVAVVGTCFADFLGCCSEDDSVTGMSYQLSW